MTKTQLLEMEHLENQLLVERDSLRKQFSREKLESIEAKNARLEALKNEQQYEQKLFNEWRGKFPALTDETFVSLWSSRLKDEAMIADVTKPKYDLKEVAKHPVYQTGLSGE